MEKIFNHVQKCGRGSFECGRDRLEWAWQKLIRVGVATFRRALEWAWKKFFGK